MKNIRNCKIRVLNAEHSKAIQEKAFEMGFSWSHKTKLKHTNAAALFFGSKLLLTFSDKEWFETEDRQEIFFYNGEFHHEPESKEIDIRGCKIAVGCFTYALKNEFERKVESMGFEILNSKNNYAFAYIGTNKCIATHSDSSDFKGDESKEVFFYDGKFHYEPELEETNADIKTHPIFDNGFQYGEVVYFVGIDGDHKAKYLAPGIGSGLSSVIEFEDSGVIATARNSELEKQSDYEDRKNFENLVAKIGNLFTASAEVVHPGNRIEYDKAVIIEFTKRLKSEDLLPF